MKKSVFNMKTPLLVGLLVAVFAQNANAQPTAASPAAIDFLLKKTTADRSLGPDAQDVADRQLADLVQQTGPRYSIFALEPKLGMVEEGKVEGLKTQPMVKLLLTVAAVNVFTGERLGSFDLSLVGTGADRAAAVRKAVLSAKKSQSAFDKGLAGLRETVSKNLSEKCPALLEEARRLDGEQKPEEALAILHGIPAFAPCGAEAEKMKGEVFPKAQAKNCQNLLQKAQLRAAANDFGQSLNLLAQVDAQAPCFAEAKAQAAAIEPKIDEETRARWDWLLRFHQTGAEAEKARWEAMTLLATEQLRASGRCCR